MDVGCHYYDRENRYDIQLTKSVVGLHSFIDILATKDSEFNLRTKEGLELRKILEIENRLKIKLPNDLINLYSYSNGLEGDDLIFNIIPLNDVDKLKDNEGYYLTFAEYMISLEICGIAIDEGDRNKYNLFMHKMDKDRKNWKRKYISHSILDFIALYFDQGTSGIFAD